jgi:hypothetical protein
VKQAAQEARRKTYSLDCAGGQEIIETKETILKEVEVAKEASQKFIEAWRSRKQPKWLGTSHM